VILASTVFDWSTRVTDGQTDGIAMAYTRYSYAVARKKIDKNPSGETMVFKHTCGYFLYRFTLFYKSVNGKLIHSSCAMLHTKMSAFNK